MDAEKNLTSVQARQADIEAKLSLLADEERRLRAEHDEVAYQHFVEGQSGINPQLKKVSARLAEIPTERAAWEREQDIATESIRAAQAGVRSEKGERLKALTAEQDTLETSCLEAIRLAGDALQAVIAKHQERARLSSELGLLCVWKPVNLASATQYHLLNGRDGRLQLSPTVNASYERRRIAALSGNLPSATNAELELADAMQG